MVLYARGLKTRALGCVSSNRRTSSLHRRPRTGSLAVFAFMSHLQPIDCVSFFFFFTILLICINRQSSGASTVICSVLTARTTLSLPCVHAYIDTQRWTWKFHWYVWRRWIYEKKQLGRYNQISSVIGRKKKVKSLICWCPRRVVDGISSTRTVHSGKFTMFLSFQENTIHSSLQKSR